MIFHLIIAVILIGSGAMMSGYHLIDDHEVLYWGDQIVADGWWSVLDRYFKSDLARGRFRPLYIFLVMVKIQMLGSNMNVWMFIAYMECLMTFFFLYAFCRLTGGSTLEGALFSGLSLFGTQITPWYRALNQENEGTLFLSLALFLTAWGYSGDSKLYKKKWYIAQLVFIVLLCSLMKEAYILIIPCLGFLALYMSSQREMGNQEKQPANVRVSIFEGTMILLWQDVKRNWNYLLALMFIFLGELYIIIFHIGTAGEGYAGISQGNVLQSTLMGMITIVWNTIQNGGIRQYVMLAGIGFVLFIVNGNLKPQLYNEKYFWALLFFLYGVSGQLFLHAKSVMGERYLLPFLVVFSVSIVYFLKTLRKATIMYAVYALTCIGFLCICLKRSWDGAESWAKWGGETEKFLETTYDKITDDRPDRILVSVGAEEFNIAVERWLWHYCGYGLNIDIIKEASLEEEYDFLIISTEDWNSKYLALYGIEKENYDVELVGDSYVIATKRLH